jgi:hypothetical protein
LTDAVEKVGDDLREPFHLAFYRLTSINGSPFAGIISAMAPGTSVYLYTWRGGEARQVTVVLGSAQCRTSG